MDNVKKAQEVGANLKKYRLSRNLSQADLAKALGVATNTICKYEKEGINDINLIMDFNLKLGVNLLCYNSDMSDIAAKLKDLDLQPLNIREFIKEINNKFIYDNFIGGNFKVEDLTMIKGIKKYISNDKYIAGHSIGELNDTALALNEIYKSYVCNEFERKLFLYEYKCFVNDIWCYIVNAYRVLIDHENLQIFFEYFNIPYTLNYVNMICVNIELLKIDKDVEEILKDDTSETKFLSENILKAVLYCIVTSENFIDVDRTFNYALDLLCTFNRINDASPNTFTALEQNFNDLKKQDVDNIALMFYNIFRVADKRSKDLAVSRCLHYLNKFINKMHEKNKLLFEKLQNKKEKDLYIYTKPLKLTFDDFENPDVIDMLLNWYNIKMDDYGEIKTYPKPIDDDEEVKFEYSLD